MTEGMRWQNKKATARSAGNALKYFWFKVKSSSRHHFSKI
jgi:hypothetical protein